MIKFLMQETYKGWIALEKAVKILLKLAYMAANLP